MNRFKIILFVDDISNKICPTLECPGPCENNDASLTIVDVINERKFFDFNDSL